MRLSMITLFYQSNMIECRERKGEKKKPRDIILLLFWGLSGKQFSCFRKKFELDQKLFPTRRLL